VGAKAQDMQEEQELQGMLVKLIFLFELLSLPFLELSVNTCPEEDRDYQPEDVMDIDEGASLRKEKEKAKVLELEE